MRCQKLLPLQWLAKGAQFWFTLVARARPWQNKHPELGPWYKTQPLTRVTCHLSPRWRFLEDGSIAVGPYGTNGSCGALTSSSLASTRHLQDIYKTSGFTTGWVTHSQNRKQSQVYWSNATKNPQVCWWNDVPINRHKGHHLVLIIFPWCG